MDIEILIIEINIKLRMDKIIVQLSKIEIHFSSDNINLLLQAEKKVNLSSSSLFVHRKE
jgi:hypothetical protein